METPATDFQHEKTALPLVFIHGIKGSVLVDGHGKKVWVSTRQALGLSTPNIKLPIEWEEVNYENSEDPHLRRHHKYLRYQQKKDDIKAKEALRSVAHAKVYGKWINGAKELNRPFYEFAYDWRRDLNETVVEFERFLTQISEKHQSKVQVVAHSMGGLITFATLNDVENVKLFHSVAFVGVPFTQGIGFVHDMHAGNKTGLNSKIFNQQGLFTCPSVYTFLPFADNPKIFQLKKNVDNATGSSSNQTNTATTITHENGNGTQSTLENAENVTLNKSEPEKSEELTKKEEDEANDSTSSTDTSDNDEPNENKEEDKEEKEEKEIEKPLPIDAKEVKYREIKMDDPEDERLWQEWRSHDRQSLKDYLAENPQLEVFDFDFFNPKDWIEKKVGIFSLPLTHYKWNLPSSDSNLESFLSTHLERALHQAFTFRSRIRFRHEIPYPPIATLACDSRDTRIFIEKDGKKSIRGFDFESLPTHKGDARVPFHSSKPPVGIVYEQYMTTMEHSSLLDDPIIYKILHNLMEKAKEKK